MWSLRQRDDGSFYLTYDRYRRFTNSMRGRWEYVGPQDSAYTAMCVRVNKDAGYTCCNDDEGGVRVLVLED
jgi:hypothetical protein